MTFPPFRDTEEMVDHIRETFKWHLRRASRPPRPLPEDYWDLCPSFTLPDAEEAARDFDIPEIIQAIFYAMVKRCGVIRSEQGHSRGLELYLQGSAVEYFRIPAECQ